MSNQQGPYAYGVLGSDTGVVNGQRFVFPTTASYAPQGWGQQVTGVPQVSPTVPPFLGGAPIGAGGLEGVGGYGTAGNNAQMTAIAAANPHNLKVSPTWWAVGLGLGALILLKVISWRETIDESSKIGPARESARESSEG